MENVTTNTVYFLELLIKVDILAIQEHWLWTFEKSFLEKLAAENHYSSFIKCTDENEPISGRQRIRGWGGCGIFWKSSLDQHIRIQSDGSERICVITMDIYPKPFCFVAVYMPTTGNKDYDRKYCQCLDELHEIVHKYSDHSIIIMGDMNASFIRNQETTRDKLFKKAVHDMGLCLPQNYPVKSTFYHHNNVSSSQIDYILSFNAINILSDIVIYEHSAVNLSTHLPTVASLYCNLNSTKDHSEYTETSARNGKIKWDKCDIEKYQQLLNEQLEMVDFNTGTVDEKLLLVSNIMKNCANESVLTTVNSLRKKNLKPWTSKITQLCKNSKKAFWLFKQGGGLKSKENQLWLECKAAKRELRQAQRQLSASRRNKLYNDIMDSYWLDQKLFYKLINRQRNGHSRKLNKLTVDDVHLETSSEIREGWANYFKQLSTPSSSPVFVNEHKQLIENDVQTLLDLQNKSVVPENYASADEIFDAMMKMKNGKAADELNLMSEHLKLGGPTICNVLKVLFDRIVKQKKIPDIFKSGIITPVYKKHNKPLEDPNSYRRITVCSIIGKVFETIHLSKMNSILENHQNCLQRGFTSNVPPTNAALLLTEAIAESKDKKKQIYAAFIDASKAFDVVWHDSLLIRLFESGIVGNDWLLVHDWYQNLKSKVKWEDGLSVAFNEHQGVRQGGIMSPTLYKTFINPLLNWYADKHLGYRIGTIHTASPTCADDIVLLSEDPYELQVMLNLQETFANKERYIISESKSKVMTFSGKRSIEKIDKFYLHDKQIEEVKSYTHIGIDRSLYDKDLIPERIKLARRTCYSLMGTGMHGYNGVNPIVIMKLWNTYARPRLLFGLDSVTLSKKDIQ